MQYSVFDFLGAALVPILGTDVTAGTAGNVHFALIGIAALGADPNQLAVVFLHFDLTIEAAFLTVVALGVQLSVHNIVVDELHDLQHSVNILLHIGNFHIADSAAGGELLEFGLEAQLGEGIDLFGNVYMIGVGNVTLIGDTGNHTEALLQALGEFVAKLNNVERFEFLPYHSIGVHKWESMGLNYELKNIEDATSEDVAKASEIVEKFGINVFNSKSK